jgi:predicted nucleotidyltransferase component of viral defense system
MSVLRDFCLVGGTALSLLHGHRISDDLDLFANEEVDFESIVSALEARFGESFKVRSQRANFGLFCFIDKAKIDFVRTAHSPIRPIIQREGIRFVSTEDIIAMKVQAVLGRARKKDFWDIALLLDHYSVEDFIRFHEDKYSTQNLMVTVPQAISYFADAEEDAAPVSLQGQTWGSVKSKIREAVRGYLG